MGGEYEFAFLGDSKRPLITESSLRPSSRVIYLSLDKGRRWTPLHMPVPPGACFPAGGAHMITLRESVYTCDNQIHPNRSAGTNSTWKTEDAGRHWQLLARTRS